MLPWLRPKPLSPKLPMALDIWTTANVAAMLTAPIAAAWPFLTPAQRALVEWLVRCQLANFGVQVGKKVEVER